MFTFNRIRLSVLGWIAAVTMAFGGPTGPVSLTCQPPGPPIVGGQRASICRGETTNLTATGCLGTVIWSTGEQGTSIGVSPHQTTRYTAVCRLPDGCVSCFAEAYTVAVGTPAAPRLTTPTPVICPGNTATLQATCAGTVRWLNTGLSGSNPTVQPQQTTTYQATCEQGGCPSPLASLTLRVASPTVPILSQSVDNELICAGKTIDLTADNCAGQVRWSDGVTGHSRRLTPYQTTRLRAVCQVGTCQSDSASVLLVRVRPAAPTTVQFTTIQNGCPYLTADLTAAIGSAFQSTLSYSFRAGSAPDAPLLGSPGAVLAGVYYVSAKSPDGCLSLPVAVSAQISGCTNGIAPCLSNPPTVSLALDSLDQKRGVVCLKAKLRGTATDGLRLDSAWTCTGTGLFTGKTTTHPRYVASEADRLAPQLTFSLATPDPDGTGPCRAGAATLAVTLLAPRPDAVPADSVLTVATNVPEANGVFIPEGFSPNGDGINDRFVIQGLSTNATAELEVFNRWGQRVFSDKNYKNDWDGQSNQGVRSASGQGLPDGTYFYVVRISDGREYVRFLTIAR